MKPQDNSTLPAVTVIIPNYNGLEHLPACLESVSRLEYDDTKLHVLVVDNASSDGSVEYIRTHHPDVRITGMPENAGFAAAINHGVSQAETGHVAFLNNDMRTDKLWLRELVSVLDPDKNIFCASSEILDWEGKLIDYSGGRLHFCGYGISLRRGDPAAQTSESPDEEKTLFPCGGAMVISKKVFEETGGFDKEYFAYYEDVDLGLRLWMNGYPVMLARNSKVYHKGFGTGKRMNLETRHFLWHRNALFTIFKNFEDDTLRKTFPAILFLAVSRGMHFLEKDSGETGFMDRIMNLPSDESLLATHMDNILTGYAQLRAVSAFLKALPELLPRRKQIQQHRKHSDAEIYASNRLTPEFGDMIDLPGYELFQAKLADYFNLSALFDQEEWSSYNITTLHKLDAYIYDRLNHIRNLEKENHSLNKSLSSLETQINSVTQRSLMLEDTVRKQEEYIQSLRLFESKVKSSVAYRLYRRIKDLVTPPDKHQ